MICKFCGKPTTLQEESLSHKGMCKKCYNDLMKYRRIVDKQSKTLEDTEFILAINKICKSNAAAQRYVPVFYVADGALNNSINKTAQRCKQCGQPSVELKPGYKDICGDCSRLENNYRNHLYRHKKLSDIYSVAESGRSVIKTDRALSKCIERIDDIENVYYKRFHRGLEVPLIYKKRKGLA